MAPFQSLRVLSEFTPLLLMLLVEVAEVVMLRLMPRDYKRKTIVIFKRLRKMKVRFAGPMYYMLVTLQVMY